MSMKHYINMPLTNIERVNSSPGRESSFDSFSTKRTPPLNYGIRIVPERTAFIIERFGKFHRVLGSGIHILIPLVLTLAPYVYHREPESKRLAVLQ